MNLNGTAAIVSGGASGLGEATARELAAAGAAVLVADLNEQRGTALAAAIGGRFVPTDVVKRGRSRPRSTPRSRSGRRCGLR